jgi:hypothetical protein
MQLQTNFTEKYALDYLKLINLFLRSLCAPELSDLQTWLTRLSGLFFSEVQRWVK